jgi:hypothetical protein
MEKSFKLHFYLLAIGPEEACSTRANAFGVDLLLRLPKERLYFTQAILGTVEFSKN